MKPNLPWKKGLTKSGAERKYLTIETASKNKITINIVSKLSGRKIVWEITVEIPFFGISVLVPNEFTCPKEAKSDSLKIALEISTNLARISNDIRKHLLNILSFKEQQKKNKCHL